MAVLRNDLCSLAGLPAGVVAIDLAEAIADATYGEIVREHLARSADYDANGFTALNTAFISHGAFVCIPKGAELESPLHLTLHRRSGRFRFGEFSTRAGRRRRKQQRDS